MIRSLAWRLTLSRVAIGLALAAGAVIPGWYVLDAPWDRLMPVVFTLATASILCSGVERFLRIREKRVVFRGLDWEPANEEQAAARIRRLDEAAREGEGMRRDDIQPGHWYETKLGIGECLSMNDKHISLRIDLPFHRGMLHFTSREVLREVAAPGGGESAFRSS